MKAGGQLSKNLIIRADASSQIGTGHVMRCLALAQAWQEEIGGEVIFVAADGISALEKRLAGEGCVVANIATKAGSGDDARQTIGLAQDYAADWIVVDGYHFGGDYQRIVKDVGLRLLFVDDYGHAERYFADIVLNQNISATESLYAKRESYSQLLLGPRYVLLRREFWRWHDWQREIPDVARKVLVTLGGADPHNATLKVIQALQQIEVDGLEAEVVIGAGFNNEHTLKSAIGKRRTKIRLEYNVNNMPELMAWADVAVSAGGTTCWELAFMGLPALHVALADNQRSVVSSLQTHDIGADMGWYESLSSADIARSLQNLLGDRTRREAMIRQGRLLVDGDGAKRVVMVLRGESFRFRNVNSDDQRFIWELSNQPEVRAASFSPEPIPWDQHVRWFKSKLDDPACIFFVVINQTDEPMGQMRFEMDGDKAVISLSLVRSFRGRGYGAEIIRKACEKVFKNPGVKVIRACVRLENETSVGVFEKAGFREAGFIVVNGRKGRQFIFCREHLQ